MDWMTWKQTGTAGLKKYGYAVLILLAGILLMVLPRQEPLPESPREPAAQPDLQQSLGQILSRMEGAGRVEVLLTEAAGERTLYQTDEDLTKTDHSEDVRRDTVLISTASRDETGLVRQVLPPAYQGALVLCQGADNASVRLQIVQAVMSVTGLSSDKITVLKMK